MKKILIVLLLIAFSNVSYSQITKGKFVLGAGVQVSGYTEKNPSFSNRYSYINLNLTLPLGIFVSDSWLIGVTPSFGKYFVSDYNSYNSNRTNHTLGITPYA